MKSFSQAVTLITVFAIMTRALGFIFRIILSRILGAELLGIYQIGFAFFMVFFTIIASGLPLIISREVSGTRSKRKVNGIIRGGLIIALGASIPITLLIVILYGPLSHIFKDPRSMTILAFLIPATISAAIYTVFRAVWWGRKNFFLLGITEFMEQVIRLIIFGVLITLPFVIGYESHIAAISFTIASYISAGLVVFLFFKKRKKPTTSVNDSPYQSTLSETRKILTKQKETSHAKHLLKSAAPITAVRVITSLALPLIAIIIPMRLVAAGWDSRTAIAHFGIAAGMVLPLLSIPQTIISSMATALVPNLSEAVKQNNQALIKEQINGCIRFTLFINFLLLVPFIGMGQGIGTFLFADNNAGAYLALSAWIMVPLSLSLITNAILNSVGAETRAMSHYLIGSVVLFACVWFLPEFIGVNALIVGLGACMTIATILNIYLIKTKTGNSVKILSLFIKFTLICVPSILLAYFMFGVLGHMFPLFINLALTGSASVFAFLCLGYVFNVVDAKSMIAKFSRRKTQSQKINSVHDAKDCKN
ncbi:MAG: oligosaccharide flippase family protein [Firmicutes bacterium]|nr:oligosaccharide flippase family protein [Bacillota bacterium]